MLLLLYEYVEEEEETEEEEEKKKKKKRKTHPVAHSVQHAFVVFPPNFGFGVCACVPLDHFVDVLCSVGHGERWEAFGLRDHLLDTLAGRRLCRGIVIVGEVATIQRRASANPSVVGNNNVVYTPGTSDQIADHALH